jgi:hypothetical protein
VNSTTASIIRVVNALDDENRQHGLLKRRSISIRLNGATRYQKTTIFIPSPRGTDIATPIHYKIIS